MLVKTVVVSSAALGWSGVSAARQSLGGVTHAAQVIDDIGSLLQDGEGEGVLDVIRRASENIDATPGAQAEVVKQLKDVIQNIETQVLTTIKDGQTETQNKINSAVAELQVENAAATESKQKANSADQAYFECVAAEQAHLAAAEKAEQNLTASRSAAESEACEEVEILLGYEEAVQGKIKAAQETWSWAHGSLEPIEEEVHSAFTWGQQSVQSSFPYTTKKHSSWLSSTMIGVENKVQGALPHLREEYNGLKAATWGLGDSIHQAFEDEQKRQNDLKAQCDKHKQDHVSAQSALASSKSEWTAQRKKCQGLRAPREQAMCNFGSKMQAKCSAQSAYSTLITATKKAKGGAMSEPDRAEEWANAALAKCMMTKAIQKAGSAAVDSADLQACQEQVNFGKDVGNLDRKEASVRKLMASSNVCENRKVTFFQGQEWIVPTGSKPKSTDYVRKPFTPDLHLVDETTGNFDFCIPAPKPFVESRPTSKQCDVYVSNAGKTFGSQSHSVVMALDFTDSRENAHKRQWMLNIGQQGTGAEHWLYTPASGAIQFGVWNGPQIQGVDISKAKHTLATVYDAPSRTYSLFIDGELAKTRTGVTFNIRNRVLAAGDKQRYHSNANFNGCISGVDIYSSALTATQVKAACAKLST